MLENLPAILQQPFYLWLIGLYPVLHLYAENLGLVKDREVPIVCAAMIAATTAAFLLANRTLQNRHKTAVILSACSLAFSFSGHAYALIGTLFLWEWTILVLVALAILLSRLWRGNSRHICSRVTPLFNLIVLSLLAIPCTRIITSYVSNSIYIQPVSAYDDPATARDPGPKVYDSDSHPDIYYIIPDGYPSDPWLKNEMNYDNSNFSAALEERGFTVVKHAQSNYGATLTSLASILNMRFLDNNPSPFGDLDFLRISIADSVVARQLQQLGYTYVHFLSGYMLPSPIADINRDFTPLGPIEITVDERSFATIVIDGTAIDGNLVNSSHFYKQSFIRLYLDTTLLRIARSQLERFIYSGEFEPYDLTAPARFLDTIEEIKSIASMPEATFTVVHLMKPHSPTVFDANGQSVEANWHPTHDEYFAEFTFTNSKFLQMIDSIIEVSDHEPIMIFQADHGSILGSLSNEDSRLTLFDSYAAYYVSGAYSIDFPKPFTLVNTFPLILNAVFGTDFEYQPNRLIELQSGYDAPFDQLDVTSAYAFNNP